MQSTNLNEKFLKIKLMMKFYENQESDLIEKQDDNF